MMESVFKWEELVFGWNFLLIHLMYPSKPTISGILTQLLNLPVKVKQSNDIGQSDWKKVPKGAIDWVFMRWWKKFRFCVSYFVNCEQFWTGSNINVCVKKLLRYASECWKSHLRELHPFQIFPGEYALYALPPPPPLEGSLTFVMLTLHWEFVVNNRGKTGIEGNTN